MVIDMEEDIISIKKEVSDLIDIANLSSQQKKTSLILGETNLIERKLVIINYLATW